MSYGNANYIIGFDSCFCEPLPSQIERQHWIHHSQLSGSEKKGCLLV